MHVFTRILQLSLPFSVLWENKLTTSFLLNWHLPLLSLKKSLGSKVVGHTLVYQRKRELNWGFPLLPEPQASGKHLRKERRIFVSTWHHSCSLAEASHWHRSIHKDHWCIENRSLTVPWLSPGVSGNQCELLSLKQFCCCINARTDMSDTNSAIPSHW